MPSRLALAHYLHIVGGDSPLKVAGSKKKKTLLIDLRWRPCQDVNGGACDTGGN